MKNLISNSKEW